MKKYDNNIELFDAYLNNSMNEEDKKAFEKRLAEDSALKQEFTIHKEMVYLLQKSCSDADREFEEAMKGISDDDFQKIVSVKKTQRTSTTVEKPKGRMVPLKSVYRWMSAAAAALLLIGIGSNLFWNHKMGDTTTYPNQIKHDFKDTPGLPSHERGIVYPEDSVFTEALRELVNGNFDQGISNLEDLYKNASTHERKDHIGTELVFAYLMRTSSDRDAAKRIIEELKKNNDGKLPSELEDIENDLK